MEEGNEAAATSGARSSGSSPSCSDSGSDRKRNRKRRRLGPVDSSPAQQAPAPIDLPVALSRPVRNARLRSPFYDVYNMSSSRRAKSRGKSGKKNRRGPGKASISKMLKPERLNNVETVHLRRSTRNRRMSTVLYDYSSSEDEEIVGHTYREERVLKKSVNSNAISKASESDRPRREGLRPRSSRRVGRIEESSQESAGDHDTTDEDADAGEDEEDEEENESESAGDEEEEGEDGVAAEAQARQQEEEEEEEAPQEVEEEEEDEDLDGGKRRYELRKRVEVQLTPQKIFIPETEKKHARGRPRPRKRRRREEDDESDDSLLVDEMEQGGPAVSWARNARGPQPFLPATLDMHGSTNWGLGIAASGWGHQGDFWGFGLAGTGPGTGTGTQTAGASSKGGADIQPVQVDESVSFKQVGGLSHYIDSLKEMVFFPLLYPKFFESYKITPPRGVLLCGPPGTGKTLVARALASAAAKAGQKVSFYMRKGADVLSKWVGEAERQLRMLFEEAQRCQPSIIFFDEIDGLAPVRSSKSEQIHNSIVSTLLALMDGLDSRGQVVVIGATNRIDAIDGALRRPGRFDREFIFPLPDAEARAEILGIHTRGWRTRPSEELRRELAASCVGYCGADLKALCTEAAIRAFRERYPQVYTSDEQFVIDESSIRLEQHHFYDAMAAITPAAHRGATVHSRPLPAMLAPCLQGQLQAMVEALYNIFPLVSKGGKVGDDAGGGSSSSGALSAMLGMQTGGMFPMVYKPRYLLCGTDGSGLEHLGPALLHKLERFPVHSLGLPSLLSDPSAKTPEEALVHIFGEARRTTPSILYLPQLHLWWDSAHDQLRTVLLMLLADLPSDLPLLLLGTSGAPKVDLDSEALQIFGRHIYEVEPPTPAERDQFFIQLINNFLTISSREASTGTKKAAEYSPLPKAPKPEKGPSEAEVKAQAEAEEHAIRRLRMCLRDVCNRLLYEKRFSIFHFPVEAEEAPNYHTVVKNPMDVATLLQRVDKGHYRTRSAFMQDVELIPANAKQYHGEDYHTARIVSRAFALFDAVQGMVSQIDPALVAFCDKIASQNSATQVKEEKISTPPSECQTRSSARLRGIQPDLNLPATDKCSAQDEEVRVVANGRVVQGEMEVEVVLPAAPQSQETTTSGAELENKSSSEDSEEQQQEEDEGVDEAEIEDLRAKFVVSSDEFRVCELEMLYARLCRGLRVQQGLKKKGIFKWLQAYAQDESNFQHIL